MLNILDSYALHTMTGDTSIAAILGLYRLISPSGNKIYVLATVNVYQLNNHNSKKFDLKGSIIGRKSSITSTVLKDLDLIYSGKLLNLEDSKERVLKILSRDVQFLKRHSIILTILFFIHTI